MSDPAADLRRDRRLRGDETPYEVAPVLGMLRREVRRPGATDQELDHDLYAVLAEAVVTREPPSWVGGRRADAWIVCDDTIALPLLCHGDELRSTGVVLGRSSLAVHTLGASGSGR